MRGMTSRFQHLHLRYTSSSLILKITSASLDWLAHPECDSLSVVCTACFEKLLLPSKTNQPWWIATVSASITAWILHNQKHHQQSLSSPWSTVPGHRVKGEGLGELPMALDPCKCLKLAMKSRPGPLAQGKPWTVAQSSSWHEVTHHNFQRLKAVRSIKCRKLEREWECPIMRDVDIKQVTWEEPGRECSPRGQLICETQERRDDGEGWRKTAQLRQEGK